MLGSLDCMYWVWESCPSGWRGQYIGHQDEPTMILEAIAGPDKRIWNCNFGFPGSLNDINVLHRSPLFDDLISGSAPNVEFTVNDGIYPEWAILVKGIPLPRNWKHRLFSQKVAQYRKDVECAFDILQKSLPLLKVLHAIDQMRNIMETYVILHNMTVQDDLAYDMTVMKDHLFRHTTEVLVRDGKVVLKLFPLLFGDYSCSLCILGISLLLENPHLHLLISTPFRLCRSHGCVVPFPNGSQLLQHFKAL
ncbi:LOW QUALITY PROTEIN: hypothetical protein U9M48_043537 [Paspalum notatum var. saurae]|uniref:DDE Tnp4 domain-containing protein n=1 Tax=Paspalum notatum var. saurae TaxID=547442 RepID=A0AAQ3USY8_PASNO